MRRGRARQCVCRIAAGIGPPMPEPLACSRCGGQLEASAKVYFDVTATKQTAEDPLVITGLEFSTLNDSYDGHPVAMEHEIQVSCSECGHAPDFAIAGAAESRTSFCGFSSIDNVGATGSPIISLLYGEDDVRGYAADAEVDEEEALHRARKWGRHIQETAAGLCAEQLMAVVISGQP